jgi:hypothetical protein
VENGTVRENGPFQGSSVVFRRKVDLNKRGIEVALLRAIVSLSHE